MRSVLRSVAFPLLTLLLATQFAWADARQNGTTHTIRMKFGPEWEFSNKGVRDSFNGKKVFDAQALFVKKLKSLCARQKSCSVNSDRKSKDYGTVTYKDGWWFKVTVDFGTIEVISKPTTLSKFRSIKSRIDNDVFGTANSLHLETNAFTYGAGQGTSKSRKRATKRNQNTKPSAFVTTRLSKFDRSACKDTWMIF
jgi:hypothetical protein